MMGLIRRFFADLVGAQVDGFRFARGLPLAFMAMVAVEFTQHIIEVHIGFFDSGTAAQAVGQDGSRMALGWIKMILVYVAGFFAIRYLLWANAKRALAVSGRSVRAYMPYLLYSLALFAAIFYAQPLLNLCGLDSLDVATFRTVIGLSQIAIEPLLMLWIVSAATGHSIGGPLKSARITGWLYFWALASFFIGRIPINAAHQLLNRFAIGQPPAVLWPMLVLDAMVVGLLVAIVPAIYVRVARFIAERRENPVLATESGRVPLGAGALG